MGTKIEDGTGGGKEAQVNEDNELVVNANSALVRASLRGDAYSWTSVAADIDTGDTMLMVRNDSARNLILSRLTVTGSNVAGILDLHLVTAAYTAAGTAVTGINLNSASSKTADATAFGDETGNTQGSVLMELVVPITTPYTVDLDGVVVGPGHAVGLDQITEATAGSAQLVGYFQDV